ncbi:MAG: hypothetical protein K2L23_07550, partial [Odoribacter sp.]|nr:hypothetical protein [Odoribacter sp.]
GYIILLVVLSLCVSCGDVDLFDTDKWSSQVEGWEPGIKGAVACGEFTLWDFLQDSTRDFRVQKELLNGDSILVVKYTKENIANIAISDVFELAGADIVFEEKLKLGERIEGIYRPNGVYNPGWSVDLEALGIEKVEGSIHQTIPLPMEFAETRLSKITLEKGICTYILPELNGDGVKYDVKVLYARGKERDTLIKGNETQAGLPQEVSLENRVFEVRNNKIELEFQITLKEGILRDTAFDVSVRFSDYDYSKIEGKVVKAGGIDINKGSFEVDLDILNDINGTVQFTDPRLELVLKNRGLGVPFGVDMKFAGEDKNGRKDTLSLIQPLVFAGNSSDTETEAIAQQINKDNSNIVEFLSLLPQGNIFYSGKVTLNPAGEENNVIYKDASLNMDINISVPLALTGNLSYCDTVTEIDIDQKYADKIIEGAIILNVQENDLPLDLSVPKMVLLNEMNLPLDTIAVTGADEGTGKIKAGQKGALRFHIDEKTARNLGQTKNILLEAAVSGDSGEPVKANAKLKFVLTLEAKAVIKDFDDF